MFFAVWILFALMLGSFANVCVHRLPKSESIVTPSSHCLSCGAALRWRENIPLASFLFLRGRCAHCRRPISLRYPAMELFTAILFGILFWRQHDTPFRLLVGGALTVQLLIVSFIDWEHRIIPNALPAGLFLTGLLSFSFNPLLGSSPVSRGLNAAAGGLTGFLLMQTVALLGKAFWKKEALGGGDVKLMAALGLLLGWKGILGTLFLGSLVGTVYAGTLLLAKKLKRESYVPFGPFLSLGAWICWLAFDALPARLPF